MAQYRKRPVIIEAQEWDGTAEEATPIINWILEGEGTARYCDYSVADGSPIPEPFIAIDTLEGTMAASKGDYIIKGVQGEFYPCKPDIFATSYEPV